MESQQVLFEEIQRLPRWVALLSGGLLAWMLLGVALGLDPGNDASWVQDLHPGAPTEIAGVALGIIGLTLATLMFLFGRMETTVNVQSIRIRYVPFHRRGRGRIIRFTQIATVEARTYRPLVEYGGWGIRWGPRGRAYNVRGNRGVELSLNGGGRIMIGSADADALETAINLAMGADV